MPELVRLPNVRRNVPARDGRAGDARGCAAVVREHGRTFYLASWLLSGAKRRDAYALYAFCRIADDLVDLAHGRYGAAAAADDVARQLADYERALDVALDRRAHAVVHAALPASALPHAAVFRELRRVVETHGVPPAVLRELLAGVARDLAPARYATWAELVTYCEGVASSVGEMCTYVFGVDPGGPAGAGRRYAAGAHVDRLRARALPYARTLGVAMQLTNILRDVGEDARRGRCYLPESDLAAFGLAPEDVLAGAGDPAYGAAGPRAAAALAQDPRWTAFAAAMVARARALYAAAAPGIALLAPDARRCASACATGYAGILGEIERAGYDTITRRASLGSTRRAAVLWQALRAGSRFGGRRGAAAHDHHAPVPDPVALAQLAS